MAMEIRLLHVDDKDLIRAGIRSLLSDSSLHLVGSTASEMEAFTLAQERFPDVLLLNILSQCFDGIQFLRKYAQAFPRQKIIVLAGSNDPFFLLQAASLGVKDYMLDSMPGLELIRNIQNVYYGTGISQNEAWNQTLETLNTPQFQEMRQKLTPREEQVLRFLVQGKSNKEIAAQLNVKADTIKEHLIRVFRKIGANDRTQAAVWAVRKGLV